MPFVDWDDCDSEYRNLKSKFGKKCSELKRKGEESWKNSSQNGVQIKIVEFDSETKSPVGSIGVTCT